MPNSKPITDLNVIKETESSQIIELYDNLYKTSIWKKINVLNDNFCKYQHSINLIKINLAKETETDLVTKLNDILQAHKVIFNHLENLFKYNEQFIHLFWYCLITREQQTSILEQRKILWEELKNKINVWIILIEKIFIIYKTKNKDASEYKKFLYSEIEQLITKVSDVKMVYLSQKIKAKIW